VSQSAIFGPVFATIGLTFCVWVTMYVKRIGYLRESRLPAGDPTVVVAFTTPPLSHPADNFRNLFEIPVLFYALAIYLFVTNQVDGVHLVTAWVFVAFRALHSLVHCTSNVVLWRFYAYAISTVAFWSMAARAAFRYVVA